MNEISNKIRIINILKILYEESDCFNPINSSFIIEKLKEKGISTSRKTIYSDIKNLINEGYDINRLNTKKDGYYVGKRTFETAEIRMLCDLVLGSQFISHKKTYELIDKLLLFLTGKQRETIYPQIIPEARIKKNNEEIYYTIDTVNNAVSRNKKISFLYYYPTIDEKGKCTLENGKRIIISPYALFINDDKYYLAGNQEKYNYISHYRIDYIKKAYVLNIPSRALSEMINYTDNFDITEYINKSINNCNGEEYEVQLLCTNDLLDVMADIFGSRAVFCKNDENRFTVRSTIFISEGLINRLLPYCDRCYVVEPLMLKNKIKERLKKSVDFYNKY